MYAAHEGHVDMLQLLLEYGVPAAEVTFGVTAVRCIDACDRSRFTELMNAMCCDCNVYVFCKTAYRKLTALHSAALGGHVACINALLQHSAGTRVQARTDQNHAVSPLPSWRENERG